jgi:branched-chain amino acid transport system permease protein
VNWGVVNEESPAGAFLREHLSQAHVLIYGILVVIVILYMPQGILGFFKQLVAKKRRA